MNTQRPVFWQQAVSCPSHTFTVLPLKRYCHKWKTGSLCASTWAGRRARQHLHYPQRGWHTGWQGRISWVQGWPASQCSSRRMLSQSPKKPLEAVSMPNPVLFSPWTKNSARLDRSVKAPLGVWIMHCCISKNPLALLWASGHEMLCLGDFAKEQRSGNRRKPHVYYSPCLLRQQWSPRHNSLPWQKHHKAWYSYTFWLLTPEAI